MSIFLMLLILQYKVRHKKGSKYKSPHLSRSPHRNRSPLKKGSKNRSPWASNTVFTVLHIVVLKVFLGKNSTLFGTWATCTANPSWTINTLLHYTCFWFIFDFYTNHVSWVVEWLRLYNVALLLLVSLLLHCIMA